MEKKKSFWDIPWPMYFVYPFKILYQKITKGKKPKLPEAKTRMIISAAVIVVSLIVIWVVRGFGNPVHMLIDDMFFLEDPPDTMSGQNQGAMYGLYMVAVGFIVMIIMKLLIYFVYGEGDHPFWTIDGISLILISVALSLLAETVLRKIGFDQWVSPVFTGPEYTDNPLDIDLSYFGLVIILCVLLFFVINDVASSVLSIYVTLFIINKVPVLGNYGNSVLSCLLLACAVNIVVGLLDRIGVVDMVCKFIIKWLYTLKYLWMLYLFPVLVVYIVNRITQKRN